EADDSIFAAMEAGARGYLLKGADQDDVMRAVRAVGSGEAIFSPNIAERLMRYFSVPKPSAPPQLFPELTERQKEVLTLVAEGHSTAEIAEKLVISLKTVRNHISNILNKLQVSDRTQAIVRAREAGLGQKG